MTTITTRSGKGSPLTNDEVDANFTNLNTDKAELSGASFTGNVSFGDNDKAIFGAGSDLQIFSEGSSGNSFINETGNGSLFINASNLYLRKGEATFENFVACTANGDVKLYFDNTARLATTATGIDVTGSITTDGLTSVGGFISIGADGAGDDFRFYGDTSGRYMEWVSSADSLLFRDGAKALFGNGSDLQIYHSGSSSFIVDTGTGNLNLQTDGTSIDILGNSGAEYMARFISNGAASLYYDAGKKLETTSTGIDVTGTAVMDALTVGGTLGNFDISAGGNQATFDYNGFNYINSTGAGSALVVRMGSGSTNAIRFDSDGKVIINDDGNDTDFRVESDNNANMLFVDAGNDRVGIGRLPSISNSKLEVGGADNVSLINVEASGVTGGMGIGASGLQLFHGTSSKLAIASSGAATFSSTIASAGVTSSNSITMTAGNMSLNSTSDGNQAFRYYRADGTLVVQQYPYNNRFNVQTYNNQGLRLKSDGSGQIELEGNVVINEDSANVDFRVESDSNSHALFVNGADGNVSFGTSDGVGGIQILSSGSTSDITLYGASASFGGRIFFGDSSDRSSIQGGYDSGGGGYLKLFTDTAGGTNLERVYLDNEGGFSVTPTANGHAVFNNNGVDADFRVESDSQSHMFFVDAGNDRIGVGNAAPSTTLEVTGNGDAETGIKVTHSRSGVGNTILLNNTNNGANKGSGVKWQSGGFDTGAIITRSDAVAASGDAPAYMTFHTSSDGTEDLTERLRLSSTGAATFNSTIAAGAATFTTADNNAQLTLVSTDTDASVGPRLDLYRNSSSPANGDVIGEIQFQGEDTVGSLNIFATISSQADQVNNGAEDGSLRFKTLHNGTLAERITIAQNNHVIINETGVDADFRVESDSNAHMLFVDAGTNQVGIGASSPAADLHIKQIGDIDNGNSQGLMLESGAGSQKYILQTGRSGVSNAYFNLRDVTNTRDIFSVIDTNGKFQGHTPFEWNNSAVFNEDSGDQDFRVESDNNSSMLFVDAGNDAVCVGTATQQATLTVEDNQASNFVGHFKNSHASAYGLGIDTGSGNQIFFYLGGSNKGSIVSNSSGTTYSTTSDQRLKENIADAPSASDDIDAIQVRSFDWKADGLHQKYGMVAQELETVAPEAVTGDADSDDMMGVDYSKLVPMLVKEIQSLRARVAQLESN